MHAGPSDFSVANTPHSARRMSLLGRTVSKWWVPWTICVTDVLTLKLGKLIALVAPLFPLVGHPPPPGAEIRFPSSPYSRPELRAGWEINVNGQLLPK